MSDAEKTIRLTVAATMNDLQQVSPELFKQLRKEIRSTADSILALARASYPNNPTGHERNGKPTWSAGGRMGYSIPKLKKGVVASLGKNYDPRTNIQRVLSVRQNDVAGAVYDMAGKSNAFTDKTKKDRLKRKRVAGQGKAFVRSLSGTPSRVMYPAVDSKRDTVEADIRAAALAMARKINPQLAKVKVTMK
jgi:hypothetical protein